MSISLFLNAFSVISTMDLTLHSAKIQFISGNLTSFFIERHHNDKWVVYFVMKSLPVVRCYLLDSRRKEVRTFTSLDSCLTTCQEVGFKADRLTMA